MDTHQFIEAGLLPGLLLVRLVELVGHLLRRALVLLGLPALQGVAHSHKPGLRRGFAGHWKSPGRQQRPVELILRGFALAFAFLAAHYIAPVVLPALGQPVALVMLLGV